MQRADFSERSRNEATGGDLCITSAASTGRSPTYRCRSRDVVGSSRSVLVGPGRARSTPRSPSGPRSARLDRPPPALVRGDSVRPRGRARPRGRRPRAPTGGRRLRADPDRGPARPRQRRRRRGSAGSRPTRRTGSTRRAAAGHVLRGGLLDLASLAERAERPRFGQPESAGSATTTARRPRPRRSGSRAPPVAGGPPAWTPRSWRTAGSR